MRRLSEEEINKLFNKLLLDGLEHHSGVKKIEFIKLISKVHGIDEKELKKVKKEDLISKYAYPDFIYSTNDIRSVEGELLLFSITKAMEFDDKKKVDNIVLQSGIKTGTYEGQYHNLYLTVDFEEGYKFIEYVNNHFDEVMNQEIVSVFVSGKTKESVVLACQQCLNVKEPDKLIIKYDDAYKSYSFRGNVILKKEQPPVVEKDKMFIDQIGVYKC